MNENNLNNNINLTPESTVNPQPIPNPLPQEQLNPTPMPNNGLETPQPVPSTISNTGIDTNNTNLTSMNSEQINTSQSSVQFQETQQNVSNTLNTNITQPMPQQPNQIEEQQASQINQVPSQTISETQSTMSNTLNTNITQPMPQQPNQIEGQQVSQINQVPSQPLQEQIPQQSVQPQEQPKQKKKSNPVLIILMFIAIIGGGAYFGYNKFFANSSSNNSNQGTGTTVTDSTEDATTDTKDYESIAKELINKYYENIFYGHTSTYCGNKDFEDIITIEESKQYTASKDYTNKAELSNYLKTILSENFINKILTEENYIEQDNKLYCYTPGKGSLNYDKNNSTIQLTNTSEEELTVNVKVVATSEGDNTTELNNIITLIKENDQWLIDSCDEE